MKWIDRKPLVIEPYRARIFQASLFTLDGDRPQYNLALTGRAKKNYKSSDLILAGLYRLVAWDSPGGNQCYVLANDLDQANDDLEFCKKLIAANPVLASELVVKQKIIERKDGKGFIEILPAGDVVGSHGKTYLYCGFDEIHGFRNWDILEAMQLDPTRADALMWITSYASIYHRPGVPLFDLMATGKRGADRRMFFSWYGADYCNDPQFENLDPEGKANPSMSSWGDDGYLPQQKTRLPSHKYRRLHLNLGGSPEGSAYNAEKVMDAIDRGVSVRQPQAGVDYMGFTDMSGGSSDAATLGISHIDGDGKFVLDVVMDQGAPVPFNPRLAVERFAAVLKKYRCSSVVGDAFAGNTFASDFETQGISYHVSELSKSKIYEAMEAPLNQNELILLDTGELENQMLGLSWRGGKIDHLNGEHDDHVNSALGSLWLSSQGLGFQMPTAHGERTRFEDGAGRYSPARGYMNSYFSVTREGYMDRIKAAGDALDAQVQERLATDRRDPTMPYYRRYERVLREIIHEAEQSESAAQSEYENRVAAYSSKFNLGRDESRRRVLADDKVLTAKLYGISAYAELRSRADTVEDLIRITEDDPSFGQKAAGDWLDEKAQASLAGSPGFGGSTPDQRPAFYEQALRETMRKYPGIAAAYSSGRWTEQAIGEAWPHVTKESPNRFASDQRRATVKSY